VIRGPGRGFAGAPEESLDRAEAEKVLRRVGRMFRPNRRAIAIAFVLLTLQTACMLAGPLVVRHGIDEGIRAGDGGALNLSAALYVAVALMALVLGRVAIRMVARIGEAFLRELRVRVFRHLMGLGLDFFEKEQTGRLMARMTSDVESMQEFLLVGLISSVQNVLIFTGALVAVFALSWKLALLTFVLIPPLVLATRWYRRAATRAYHEVRERIGHNLATLQEGLAGVRVVQAFGQESAYAARFEATNEAQHDANLETARINTRYFPFVEYLGVIGVATIVGVGGWFANEGIVTVGTVAAFVLYLGNLFEPIQQLGQIYGQIQSSAAALHKLFELLDTLPSIAERPGAIDLPEAGAVTVDHVYFAYGRTPVLRDVSLRIEPGERLALVGPTGAGKSSLAKVVARFYDPRQGVVSYGGVDLRDATIASLRQRIVVVPQEGYLFHGTIRDNVRIGRPSASDEDVEHALHELGILDRFRILPEGLDTEVRERGSRLSAGERQLVSLARAALADPAVLVLDEATSNLDPGTERAMEHALEQLTGRRTVIVVAHRLSTAARADRIAVIDHGRLVELGTHDELVRREGRYARLYESWSSTAVSL
jgi:ATP-binding cassette subfamily B protein